MILQYVYKPILNAIYEKVTFKLSDTIRNIILSLCFFGIIVIQFLSLYENLGIFTSQIRDLCLWVILIFVIVISVNSKTEFVLWNKKVYCVYIFIAAVLLITGIVNKVGLMYIMNACMLLTVCIGIYFVWGNRGDYSTLFRIVAKAFLVFNMILMVYSVLRYPCFDLYMEAHSGGYTIMGINTNGFAKILVPGVASAMYLLIKAERGSRRALYAILFGISAYVLWITNCRTGQMCDVAIVLYGLLMFLVNEKKQNSSRYLKKLMTVIMFIMIGTVIMGTLLNYISPITAQYLSPNIVENSEKAIEEQKEKKELKIKKWKETGGEKGLRPGSFSYALAEGRDFVGDSNIAKSLNNISTGRVYLWASYIDSLTPFGTDNRTEYKSPHNLFIDIAYKSGVIAGILWLLFCLTVGVISFSRSIMKKNSIYEFTFLMFIQFFFFAMLDTGTLFIDRSYIFVYYIALAPLFILHKSSKKEVDK